jgi:hypothetical protein
MHSAVHWGEPTTVTAAIVYWKGWKAVSILLVVAIAAYFSYFALKRPAWDWDMVPYTLSVLGDSDKTWALVKAYVPARDYALLIDGDAYRRDVFADPALLASQLPLYENKLGYVLLLKALSPIADPIAAMMALTLVSALGTLAILFRLSWPIAGVASLGWLLVVKLFDLTASLASPDTVEAFIAALGFWTLLARRYRLAVAILVAGAVVRPDAMIVGVILGLAILRLSRVSGLTLIAGSVAAYLLDMLVGRHIGWWGQLHFNFLGVQSDLRGFDPPFSMSLYLQVLLRQLVELAHLQWFYLGLGAAMLGGLLLARRDDKVASVLLLALLVSAVLRFVAYPSVEMRLYWPLLFGLAMVMLHAASDQPAARRP